MRDMDNKRKQGFKIVISCKVDGKIHEFFLASDFKNDYHHGDVDVVGLERCK